MSKSGYNFDQELANQLDTSEVISMTKELVSIIRQLSELEQRLLKMNRDELHKYIRDFKSKADLSSEEKVKKLILEHVAEKEAELRMMLPFLEN